MDFPDDALMRVCPETIYRWIYADGSRRDRWARCLPRGHRRRRRRGGRRAPRFPIPGRTPIHERPFDPGDRGGFGHWEADSVIGTGCHLHTEVERRTRFLMAAIIPDRTADESVGAQWRCSPRCRRGARASVTRATRVCATSWAWPRTSPTPTVRGSNENRNGMIRYLPKRAVIDPGMAREVQEIVDEINNRPMRVLGYRTPAEAFTDELLNLKTQQGCCTYK